MCLRKLNYIILFHFVLRIISQTAILLLILNYSTLLAQPTITWQKVWGTAIADDEIEALAALPNQTFAAAGITTDAITGQTDILIFWLNEKLQITDTFIIAAPGDERAYAIAPHPEGGVVVAGYLRPAEQPETVSATLYRNGQDTQNIDLQSKGEHDAWAFYLNQDGEIEWSLTMGGSNEDLFRAIATNNEGQFLLAGYAISKDGDIKNHIGLKDAWAMQIDGEGNLIWQGIYGGDYNEQLYGAVWHPDKLKWIAAGSTASPSGNGQISFNHGATDCWVIALDAETGELQSEKTFGGSQAEIATDIVLTTDGNLIFCAPSLSNDGDLTANYGDNDMWVAKLNSNDWTIDWQTSWGEKGEDQARALMLNPENGDVIIVGTTFDFSISPPNYFFDLQLLRLNKDTGEIVWHKKYGGSNYDFGNCIVPGLGSDEYLVGGYTDSTDGDIVQGGIAPRHGADNAWLIRFAEWANGVYEIGAVAEPLFIEQQQQPDKAVIIHLPQIAEQGILQIVGTSGIKFYEANIAPGTEQYLIKNNPLCKHKGLFLVKYQTKLNTTWFGKFVW